MQEIVEPKTQLTREQKNPKRKSSRSRPPLSRKRSHEICSEPLPKFNWEVSHASSKRNDIVQPTFEHFRQNTTENSNASSMFKVSLFPIKTAKIVHSEVASVATMHGVICLALSQLGTPFDDLAFVKRGVDTGGTVTGAKTLKVNVSRFSFSLGPLTN
jgi:hypothetical protein